MRTDYYAGLMTRADGSEYFSEVYASRSITRMSIGGEDVLCRVRMCFPYGSEIEVAKGEGRVANLTIERIDGPQS